MVASKPTLAARSVISTIMSLPSSSCTRFCTHDVALRGLDVENSRLVVGNTAVKERLVDVAADRVAPLDIRTGAPEAFGTRKSRWVVAAGDGFVVNRLFAS